MLVRCRNEPYTLYAEFDNIGGLKVKAPVKMAGVVVGWVTDIQLDGKSFRARATLAVDSQYQFSRDVSAEILTSGLLGEQYIGLMQEGGDPDNLAAGDGSHLAKQADEIMKSACVLDFLGLNGTYLEKGLEKK